MEDLMGQLKVDVIIGMQHGDEGKGKVTHHLLRKGKYTHCVRYNGGATRDTPFIITGKSL